MGWFIGIICFLGFVYFSVCCIIGWIATEDPLFDTPDGEKQKIDGKIRKGGKNE